MKPIALSLALLTGIAVNSPMAAAETLLIERVQNEQSAPLPARGDRMAQVEARFGAPSQKYPAVAGPGSRKHNPPITRWAYQNFNVYFEYDHVVDAVLNKASSTEAGPAPPQK